MTALIEPRSLPDRTEIFASLLHQFDVALELVCPQDLMHARCSLHAKILEECGGGPELLAMSLPGILNGFQRSLIREAKVKRQAAIHYDLAIKKVEGRRHGETEGMDNALCLTFDIGANSCSGRHRFDCTHLYTSIELTILQHPCFSTGRKLLYLIKV